MGDVRLSVESLLPVHAALDPARSDSFNDRRHTREKVIRELFGFQAPRKCPGRLRPSLLECLLRPQGCSATHENADVIELLPGILERQQSADLEMTRRDVEALGDVAPLTEVRCQLPAVVA